MTNLKAVLTSQYHGYLHFNDIKYPCFLGKNGIINAEVKREGDSKSPIGTWPIRKVYYRADKINKPDCKFETIAIEPDFGWCDAPEDENYNCFVKHPYKSSAEKLWRDDGLYDICVVLGHNDNPVKPFMGSAIFLHCDKENYKGTEGCVALNINDLKTILENIDINSTLEIS